MCPPELLEIPEDVDEDFMVLDVAASPGSKTTQLGDKMKNCGILVANELDFKRLGPLKINLERKTGVIWQTSKRAQFIKTALFALLLVGVIFEGAALYAAVAFILILALINLLFPPILIKK